MTGAGPRDPGRPRPKAAGRAGGARPAPSPGSGHAGGPALCRWQRVAGTLLPHPHALQGSKVKIKRITMRARLARGRRDSTSPQLASWRGSQGSPQPSSSAHLEPREERHKGTAASRPAGRSSCRLPARVCGGREGGHYRQPSERPVLEATPGGPLQCGRLRGDRLNNLERKPALSPHFEFSRTRHNSHGHPATGGAATTPSL